MELEAIYENAECKDFQNTTGPQTQSHGQDEGKDLKRRGSRRLVLITVGLGLICVLLLVFIILQQITITAERDLIKSYKNTAEEFNQAINSLQDNYTDLMTEKHQLPNKFSSLSQKNLELETRVKDLTAEKSQLQGNFNSLSQKKLELETRVKDLTAEESQLQSNFNSLSQKKLELETRVKDLTAEKSQLQSNFNYLSQKKLELETRIKDLTAEESQLQGNFNSLSQKKLELETRINDLTAEKIQLQGNFNSLSQKKLELETRVKDLTAEKSQLQSNFNSLSQKKLELETKVNGLTAEKSQLQGNFNSLSQKKLELESRVRSLSEELKKEASKRGWFFMSSELKSWSDSRQYCRERGADLVIINTEEKQRFMSSFTKERVWIGLSDTENEGNMKWVDNSPLKQGFWLKDEPSNYGGIEDCIELNYKREQPGWSPLNSWNDRPCLDKIKGICEK